MKDQPVDDPTTQTAGNNTLFDDRVPPIDTMQSSPNLNSTPAEPGTADTQRDDYRFDMVSSILNKLQRAFKALKAWEAFTVSTKSAIAKDCSKLITLTEQLADDSDNAPVTKGLVMTCAIVSVILGMKGGASACGLSYQAIVRKLHLWRLATSAFVFSSTPELVFGLYLLYYFRVFERQIGSNKYSVFVLFSIIFTICFELIVLVVFKDPTSSILAPGPYGLIFSSFIPFYFDIPVSTWFRIFGIRFSDKSFVYLAGLQLLLSSWKRTFIPGLCGIAAGLSYRLNVFGVRRIKFPEQLACRISRLPTLTLPVWRSTAISRGNVTREAVTSYDRQFE
ncbi:hypothetical protein KI387_019636, partial [Taxus chinensis]